MKDNERNKVTRESQQFDPLNSELGAFGLEPPKRYRSDQQTSSQEVKKGIKQQKKAPSRRKKKPELTKNEKLAQGKKKRKLKKKIRYALAIAGVVLVVAISIVVLSLTVFFKIDAIQINGVKTYKTSEVSAVLPIQKENNLFLLDKKSASKKLEENLPYIYDVDIQRKLPSTLVVNITETPVVYYVKNSDNSFTYFDDNFKIIQAGMNKAPKKGIEIRKIAFEDVIVGKVSKITKEDLQPNIKALMKVVSDLQIKKITAICSDNAINNYIVYDNRITIKLGEITNLEDKVYSALSALEKLNDTNPEAEGVLTSTGGKQIYFTEKK